MYITRTSPFKVWQTRATLWIDAETFLPVKGITKDVRVDTAKAGETYYANFGAPVDVQVRPSRWTLVPLLSQHRRWSPPTRAHRTR